MRLFARAPAPLLIALLLSACAPATQTAPSATASSAPATSFRVPTPAPTPTLRLRTPQPVPSPTRPELVLSFERSEDIPSIGPELLVTSDGELLSAPPWGKDVSVRQLSTAGVDLLRRTVLDTHLFTVSRSIERRPLPGASPNLNRGFESLSITVRDGDRNVGLSTFAHDDEEALYAANPEREELLTLADRLSDLSWLPASAWADQTTRPYVATFHRLYIQTAPNLTDCGGRPGTNCLDPLIAIHVDEVWPFTVDPGQFGIAVPTDPNWPSTYGARCAILTADDARALGEGIARTNGDSYHPERRITKAKYRWPAGSGDVHVQLEPLLPDIAPTCDGVRDRP